MRLSALILAGIIHLICLNSGRSQNLEQRNEYSWQEQDSVLTTLFQGRAYNVVALMAKEAYDKEKAREETNAAAVAAFALWQGISYLIEQKSEEAHQFLDEALAIYDEYPELRTDKYRDALLNKAELNLQEEDPNTAVQFLNKAISYMASNENRDRELYFSTIREAFNLSLEYQDLTSAETLGRQALSVAQIEFGNESDEYIQALSNIGRIYVAKGDWRRASNLMLQSYQLSKQYLPQNSIRKAYYGLAAIDVQEELGRIKSVDDLYDELIALFDRFTDLQEDNIYPKILSRYGKHLESQGNLDDAYQYLNRSNILLTLRVQSTDPAYIQSQSDVGQILVKQQKYTEASGYYEDAIRQAQLAYGEDSWTEGILRDRLGSLYAEMNRPDAALEQRQKTVEIMNMTLGPNDPQYALSLVSLGLSYAANDQRTEAEDHLMSAYEKIVQLYGEKHLRSFSIQRHLSDFYRGYDADKAADFYDAAANFMVYYYQNCHRTIRQLRVFFLNQSGQLFPSR